MKQAIILIPFIGWLLLAGCKSNQGEITDNKTKTDSSVVANLNLKENKIGVFEPPDSIYTGDYFEKYPSGVIKVRGGFQMGKKSGKWMYFFTDGKFSKDPSRTSGEDSVFNGRRISGYEPGSNASRAPPFSNK